LIRKAIAAVLGYGGPTLRYNLFSHQLNQKLRHLLPQKVFPLQLGLFGKFHCSGLSDINPTERISPYPNVSLGADYERKRD
jgi:hypothetical protein